MSFGLLTDRAKFAARAHMVSLARQGAEFADPEVAATIEATFEAGYLCCATEGLAETLEERNRQIAETEALAAQTEAVLAETREERDRERAEMEALREHMQRYQVDSETRQNEYAAFVERTREFDRQMERVDAMKAELRELLDNAEKQRAQIVEKQRILDARLAEGENKPS
jgi:chromosome segregation ATPase